MAGIADLKAKLAEIESEIEAKTQKAYSDLGRAVAAVYKSGSNSISVTDEIREILEELTSGASPRARGKRITAKSVTARLVDAFGLSTEEAEKHLNDFSAARVKKFLPLISTELDNLEANGKTDSQSVVEMLRELKIKMDARPKLLK